jgi:hypothetical protein
MTNRGAYQEGVEEGLLPWHLSKARPQHPAPKLAASHLVILSPERTGTSTLALSPVLPQGRGANVNPLRRVSSHRRRDKECARATGPTLFVLAIRVGQNRIDSGEVRDLPYCDSNCLFVIDRESDTTTGYSLNTNGGPLTRLAFSLIVTST